MAYMKNALVARIKALSARAEAHQESLGKDHSEGYFDRWEAENTKIEAELNAIDKEAGKGLVVGRCLTFGVADGSASYLITKVRKNDVIVEPVPIGDGYHSQAVGLTSDKRNYCVLRSTAEHYCR